MATFCSAGSSTPLSVPSLIMCWMSSTLTPESSRAVPPRMNSTASVVSPRNQTIGRAAMARKCMGKATKRASASAFRSANRLGASSPRISEQIVIPTTTMPRAIDPACRTTKSEGTLASRSARNCATCGPAIGRRERADERNAHLHRGQKAARIVGQLQGHAGSPVAFLGALLQAAAARGDDGDLGAGKEAVGQNQGQNDQDFNTDRGNGETPQSAANGRRRFSPARAVDLSGSRGKCKAPRTAARPTRGRHGRLRAQRNRTSSSSWARTPATPLPALCVESGGPAGWPPES